MVSSFVNHFRPLLYILFHQALNSSVARVRARCKTLSTTMQEPDFIADLVLNFSPVLFNTLVRTFPTYKFSLTSIYCHQKPIVDIGSTKDPELGDILFIYVYKDMGGKKQFNSLLLQAKITRKNITKVSPGDAHQLELYSKWPKFTYKRAGKLNGISRDIIPKAINDGGQYLMIDDSIAASSGTAGNFPMGCAKPAAKLILDTEFSSELIDFLKFKSGRSFEEHAKTSSDDWTKMIWELLQIAKDKASKRHNSGLSSFPRVVSNQLDGCCFFKSTTTSMFDDLHRSLSDSIGSLITADNFFDENPAPSVVVIESQELDLENYNEQAYE
jgi:hypothetical protein